MVPAPLPPLSQGKKENGLLSEEDQLDFVVARNRPENDENWNHKKGDKEWEGKASMSKVRPQPQPL